MIRRISKALCVALLLGVMGAPAFARVEGKIVGGVEAAKGEYPFIVSLQSGSHFCGGSLIKKNWVLTAGHCVSSGSQVRIVVGLHDQRNVGEAEVFSAAEVIRHPGYNGGTIDYDFSLIRLNGESQREPVELNTSELQKLNETMLTTAGWGVTKEGGWTLPDLLQKVDVPFVNKARCEAAYPNSITDRMICAGFDAGGKDSCQGDSGGPLVLKQGDKNVLVGVVSWGEGCARANKYGVYAKVSSVLDWISETTK